MKGTPMWSKKILVAYDGSAPSHKALDIVHEIAKSDPDIEVVFAHVLMLYASGSGAAGIDAVVAEDAIRVEDELEQLASELPNKTHVRILKGTSPADLIVGCALDEGCDLIVMGSRGKGGVKGYLGSVSYKVTKESPVTVMIAKDDTRG